MPGRLKKCRDFGVKITGVVRHCQAGRALDYFFKFHRLPKISELEKKKLWKGLYGIFMADFIPLDDYEGAFTAYSWQDLSPWRTMDALLRHIHGRICPLGGL